MLGRQREPHGHVAALDHGLARLREGFPLSNRLLREIHAVLLSGGRGSGKDPGEFRRSQNWKHSSAPIWSGTAACGGGTKAAFPGRVPPILSLPEICRTTGLSFPAASSAMDLLAGMKIARELTGKRRNRLFVYDRYLSVLNEGTERP